MPITMIPAQPLSPASQMQAQALAQSLFNQGAPMATGLSPGLNAFAQALGHNLRQRIGQYQQNNLNAQTMVSPIEGP